MSMNIPRRALCLFISKGIKSITSTRVVADRKSLDSSWSERMKYIYRCLHDIRLNAQERMREMAGGVSSSWHTRTKEVHVAAAVKPMAWCLNLCDVPQASSLHKKVQGTDHEKQDFTKGWKVVYKTGTKEMSNQPETCPRRENNLKLSVAEHPILPFVRQHKSISILKRLNSQRSPWNTRFLIPSMNLVPKTDLEAWILNFI
jgi:hypothetical protein